MGGGCTAGGRGGVYCRGKAGGGNTNKSDPLIYQRIFIFSLSYDPPSPIQQGGGRGVLQRGSGRVRATYMHIELDPIQLPVLRAFKHKSRR